VWEEIYDFWNKLKFITWDVMGNIPFPIFFLTSSFGGKNYMRKPKNLL
jgi:uncharacterized membrane protein